MIRSLPNTTSMRGLYMISPSVSCYYYTTESLKILRFQHLLGVFPKYWFICLNAFESKALSKLSKYEFHGFRLYSKLAPKTIVVFGANCFIFGVSAENIAKRGWKCIISASADTPGVHPHSAAPLPAPRRASHYQIHQ